MLDTMQIMSAELFLAYDAAATPLRARILIADPDPRVCQVLMHYFEEFGADVRVTKLMPQTLGIARVWQPNLILMSRMFCEQAALMSNNLFNDSRTNHIPIISLLDESDEMNIHMTLFELGIDNLVSKPLDLEELRLRVKTLLHLSTG